MFVTEERAGSEPPLILSPPPGPKSRAYGARLERVGAPMGPRGASPGIVLSHGLGSNVFDADGNRYVDLAGGFGALLLGHAHPEIARQLAEQSGRLTQALGDVYPSEPKIELLEALAALYPAPARALLAQSGSDAVSAALKTALLHTGRPGVVAFSGAYHGLGYGPLAALGLRPSYREPFAAQLNPHLSFLEYPSRAEELEPLERELERLLATRDVGAVLVEPILGRGGVVVPPAGFFRGLRERTHAAGALLIADEVWTGLGRSGKLLCCLEEATPDLICLGKGLGGGVPLSAVIGDATTLQSWSREEEVVHTSTFAGAPLASRAALGLLDVLTQENLAERARELGERFGAELRSALGGRSDGASVRGRGLMIGVDLGRHPGAGARLQRALLERGYVTSTGGGRREVLVLTPALNISERQLFDVIPVLAAALETP